MIYLVEIYKSTSVGRRVIEKIFIEAGDRSSAIKVGLSRHNNEASYEATVIYPREE